MNLAGVIGQQEKDWLFFRSGDEKKDHRVDREGRHRINHCAGRSSLS